MKKIYSTLSIILVITTSGCAVNNVGNINSNKPTTYNQQLDNSQVQQVTPVKPTNVNNSTTTPALPAPNGTYKNVDNKLVPSPYYAPTAPVGATAKCRDGTYSFSQHRSGTCSHHGGVAEWL